jgi:hypothetical protein
MTERDPHQEPEHSDDVAIESAENDVTEAEEEFLEENAES